MNIFTLSFLTYSSERAGKTFVQAGLGALVANQTGVVAVDWKAILWLSLLAAAGSLLTSINGFTSPLVGIPAAAVSPFPEIVPLTVPTVATNTPASVSILPPGFGTETKPVPPSLALSASIAH
jgi:hypothetical protein